MRARWVLPAGAPLFCSPVVVCSCFVRLLAPFRLRLSSSSPAPFGVWFRWGWWADYLMGLWCVSPRDFFSSLLMFREETVAPCGGQFLIGFSALILPLVPDVLSWCRKGPAESMVEVQGCCLGWWCSSRPKTWVSYISVVLLLFWVLVVAWISVLVLCQRL